MPAWSRRLISLIAIIFVAVLIISAIPKPKHYPSITKPKPTPPFFKPVVNNTSPPIVDNFPIAASAKDTSDLPSIPRWNQPKHVTESTPLFIGFTRNWRVLQQCVVSYITAGWPPEDIFVIENTGTMNSNKKKRLSLQNPFYLDIDRLTNVLGVNVISTPTLFTFAQLQNFYLHQAIENEYKHYFWSHMDVVALSNERHRPYESLYHRAVKALRESREPSFGKWGTRFFAYDWLTLVNTEAFLDVGGWDTMIPYYGTDCDMHGRLDMNGWRQVTADAGYIYDVGTAFDELSILYRENSSKAAELCDPDASREKLEYGVEDCRFDGLVKKLDEMQKLKSEHKGGRNFWQGRQMGGQDEPFHTDPEGFEVAIVMHFEHGKAVMAEKWGRRGCDLNGLKPEDAWKVEHEWDRD